MYIVLDDHAHLMALADSLLSISHSTRGKFLFLRSLVPHISVDDIVTEWPRLPNELMSVMNLQVLACRVSYYILVYVICMCGRIGW